MSISSRVLVCLSPYTYMVYIQPDNQYHAHAHCVRTLTLTAQRFIKDKEISKCIVWVKDLAMRWREQLKSETCFLKKVIHFEYGRIFRKMQLNYNTRQRQQRTSDKKGKIEKEKRKKPREKSTTTPAKENVTGRQTERSKIWLFLLRKSKELHNPMQKIIIL